MSTLICLVLLQNLILSVVKHNKGMHLSVGMSNETILNNIHWLVDLAVRVFNRARCNFIDLVDSYLWCVARFGTINTI